MFVKTTNNKRENSEPLKSPTSTKKLKLNEKQQEINGHQGTIKLFKVDGFEKHDDYLHLDLKLFGNEDVSVECFLHDSW
jgi:hypothetical protein